MHRFIGQRFTILFEGPGDPGGGGAPGGAPGGGGTPAGAPAGSPSSAAPPAPGGTPAPGGPGTPPPSSAGTPPGTPPRRFEYAEDRSDWVPQRRLSEVSGRARHWEDRANQLQAMIEAGTNMRFQQENRPSPEVLEARNAMEAVYPGFNSFMEQGMPMLMKLAQALQQGNVDPAIFGRVPEALDFHDHHWANNGRQALQTIYGELAKDYGGGDFRFKPWQEQAIGRSFEGWLREDRNRVQRFSYGDRALLDEFLTEYRGGFIEPFRRNADADTLNAGNRNRGLPPAPRGGGLPPNPPPQDNSNPDAVHDRAFASFQNMMRGAGR